MLFLTGASGMLGSALLARWRQDHEIVSLLHQHRPGLPCRMVTGDICLPKLGLPARDYATLCAQVTGILHCAALTEFTAPAEDAGRVNVRGTLNLLAFARDCPRLERVGVLSTSYVAGRRCGLILESELEHRAGFVNVYEQSKYRMERQLRKLMKALPIAIYRLSTIIGNARSGRVERFNAVHRALRLYYNGLVPLLPGSEDSAIELISSDYAADAIAQLFTGKFCSGQTYHIVATNKERIPLAEFLDVTAELFARFDRRWKARGVAAPPIVPLATFRILERSVERAGNPLLRQTVRAMGAFAPQLCYPKCFDATQAMRALRAARIRPLPLREYYPAIIRHCIETRWGTRA